jgi:hypothetical protein
MVIMDQLVTIIEYLIVITMAILYIISVLGPRRYFSIILICGFGLGLMIGFVTHGFPSGIFSGILIGFVMDAMLITSLFVRFYREKSLEILHRSMKDK